MIYENVRARGVCSKLVARWDDLFSTVRGIVHVELLKRIV